MGGSLWRKQACPLCAVMWVGRSAWKGDRHTTRWGEEDDADDGQGYAEKGKEKKKNKKRKEKKKDRKKGEGLKKGAERHAEKA